VPKGEKKPKVYNLIDFNTYLLLESIILDNRAAIHLVNSIDRLVPSTFILATLIDIVEVGT